MSHIYRLETLGIEPEFFHLPRAADGSDAVEYYLIQQDPEAPLPVQQAGEWDLLAVVMSPHNPHECVLRQIHIEKEALRWPHFDAWTDGIGLQSFNPATLHDFQAFLLALAQRLPTSKIVDEHHAYFVPASASDYAACGIPQMLLDSFLIHFRDTQVYRYEPDELVKEKEACCFLRVSDWTLPAYSLSATLFVAFETYATERIDAIQKAWVRYVGNQTTSPDLDASIMDAESTLRFSRGALLVLSHLLDECLIRLVHK